MQPSISPADIERMRTLIAQHDSARATENNSFDLNNPPRKNYVHQEWPMLVYNHDTRKAKAVNDAEALDQALEAGWVKEPFSAVYEAPPLSRQEMAEVDRLDRLISEAKRNRKAS